jgi:hypothetical protein
MTERYNGIPKSYIIPIASALVIALIGSSLDNYVLRKSYRPIGEPRRMLMLSCTVIVFT